jgi:hypothetical protein
LPDGITDLGEGLLLRGDGIITFTHKSIGKRLHPLVHDRTVFIDIFANLEIVELLATSDDRVQHRRADTPANVPRNVENGRAIPGVFVANAESGASVNGWPSARITLEITNWSPA